MQTKTKKFLAEFWPTLSATLLCLILAAVWLAYFSTSVRVKPMLEQPGVVPFYASRSATPNPEFGISLGNTLLRMPDGALQQRLADLDELGVDWIRIDFGWDDIQPVNRTHFDWAKHDRLVRVANQHGLRVVGIVAYTPPWARDPVCSAQAPSLVARQKCAPQGQGDFARFAAEAAARYPTVGAWEIWNEPNSTGFWRQMFADGRVDVDPATYGALASVTAAAIKQRNPHVFVITGGLAHIVSPEDPKGMQTNQFLKQALPFLDKSVIDAIGVHPYTSPALPITPQEWNAYYTLTEGSSGSLRGILTTAGWDDHLLWATEFGATTVGVKQTARTASSSPAVLHQYDHVTEELQAEILQKAIIGWCRKPQVGPLFMYTDTDQSLKAAAGNEAGFGLRRADGTAKPAYDAVRQAIATAKQSCK